MQVSGLSGQYGVLATNESLRKEIPANAFGAKLWEEYFGLKVDEPPLPLDIDKILNSQCPFSETGLKIQDTQMLVLIPGSINGESLTLKNFGELVGKRFSEFGQRGYQNLDGLVKENGCDGKTYWVLMTKSVIPESRNKDILQQRKQIEAQGKGDYHVPKALEAAVCLIAEYARSGIRLFDFESMTYSRCNDECTYDNIDLFQVSIGFAAEGLRVLKSGKFYARDFIGSAALRRL